MRLWISAPDASPTNVRVFDIDSNVEFDRIQSIDLSITPREPIVARITQRVIGGFSIVAGGKVTVNRMCERCGHEHECCGAPPSNTAGPWRRQMPPDAFVCAQCGKQATVPFDASYYLCGCGASYAKDDVGQWSVPQEPKP